MKSSGLRNEKVAGQERPPSSLLKANIGRQLSTTTRVFKKELILIYNKLTLISLFRFVDKCLEQQFCHHTLLVGGV